MSRVSVILCSYNQAKYLPDAIKSVFDQTHEDVELIIVDNGSTDESQDIIRKQAENPRVKVILHEKNDLIGNRLNEGIRASSGEFISLLYSDDYYLPHKLKSQVEIFAKLPRDYGVVYSPGYRLDVDDGRQWLDKGATVSGSVFHHLLKHIDVIHPISPLCRRECYEEMPFYDDLFVEGEEIYRRFAMKWRFQFDREPTVVMRDHASNIGRAIRRNIETMLIVLDKIERDPRFPKEETPTLATARFNLYRTAAWQGIRVLNDRAWARKMAMASVGVRRTALLRPKIAASLALSIAPDGAIGVFNSVVNRFTSNPGRLNYVADERVH